MNIQRILKITIFSIGLLSLGGCVSYPPGAALEPAKLLWGSKTGKDVWLDRVSISDDRLSPEDKELLEVTLTRSIGSYLQDSGVASTLVMPPLAPSPRALIFEFDFNRYHFDRKTHPAYFPLAVLTLTFYIWFNGPIFIDEVDYAASLNVIDSKGRSLFLDNYSLSHKDLVGFHSPQYFLPSTGSNRTEVIEYLLKQYLKSLESR